MNQVIQGNTILSTVPVRDPAAHFALLGSSRDGQSLQWPLGSDQLSRHMLLLGGIGTGKSNAFNHIIRSVRRSMTQNDVMVIFDTKGDFYNEFTSPATSLSATMNAQTAAAGQITGTFSTKSM